MTLFGFACFELYSVYNNKKHNSLGSISKSNCAFAPLFINIFDDNCGVIGDKNEKFEKIENFEIFEKDGLVLKL